MAWFKRQRSGIVTSTKEKKETPEGIWKNCPRCKKVLHHKETRDNHYVCIHCGEHMRMGSEDYFKLLFDDHKYTEHFAHLEAGDPLDFEDTKKYKDRLKEAQKKTGLKDAMRVADGKVEGLGLVVACMDFAFVGGSMGSVVGEKISRAIDVCLKKKLPLMIISQSGGARMMEAAFSLMQMAKTSAKLTLMADAGLPYISFMTDPTTGGVTASYAMLGDVNLAEPNALIGFAGPRVIRETIKKDLPEGFQSSEFLIEKGFLDRIVERKDLKATIARFLRYFKK